MACEGELQILYEDRDLLVLEKQGGTPCHPGRGHFEDSLGNRAAAYLKEQGEDGVVRAVGRLDKDTSGVMVYAKSRIAAALSLIHISRLLKCVPLKAAFAIPPVFSINNIIRYISRNGNFFFTFFTKRGGKCGRMVTLYIT